MALATTDDPLGCDLWFDISNGTGPNTVVTPSGDWKLATGREAYRQSLVRRFVTNPGEWKTKPGYGAGLGGMVRKKLTATLRNEAVTAIRAQALLDSRTKSVDTVSISRLVNASGVAVSGWRVHVVVTPKVDPNPIDIVFQVTP